MSWLSQLNDVAELQIGQFSSDDAGGQTLSHWTTLCRIRCRIVTKSGSTSPMSAQKREGVTHNDTIIANDDIPKSLGHKSLSNLLDSQDADVIRFVSGSRIYKYAGHSQMFSGNHRTAGKSVGVQVVRTPDRIGMQDRG